MILMQEMMMTTIKKYWNKFWEWEDTPIEFTKGHMLFVLYIFVLSVVK